MKDEREATLAPARLRRVADLVSRWVAGNAINQFSQVH